VPHKHVVIGLNESDDARKISLNNGYRDISMPISSRKTIELIYEQGNQEIGSFDDDLDWESRKLVVSTLLKEGLITKATD